MFDLDKWQEIFDTISKNKLRTFLTGFSVFWGIFMLVILLGSGNALYNGTTSEFKDDAQNSLWIYPGQTSLPHNGMKPGRYVRFTNEDYEAMKNSLEGVGHITSRFYIRGTTLVSYKNESSDYDIRCTHPDHKYLENTIIQTGRFLNDNDIDEHRKVACIGELIKNDLFGNEDPIGKYIQVNKVPFKVIGTFKDEGGEGEMRKVYLPISTAQKVFNGRNRVHQIMFTMEDADIEKSVAKEDEIVKLMAERHQFSPEDERAIHVRNMVELSQMFVKVFQGIKTFIWIIGFGTILAGIVGVSNIMMIVVKERTKEIGIRKALGATPFSIISLIVQEALIITAFSGYFGMVAGVGLLELANTYLPPNEFFLNPAVDLNVAIKATILLVVSGTLAGLYPAMKAADIKPIEALRDE